MRSFSCADNEVGLHVHATIVSDLLGGVGYIIMQFMSIICSLGCGIGYGYLHRIPSELLEQKQKARMGVNPIPAPPMPATAPPITPTKDGFSDVSISAILQ